MWPLYFEANSKNALSEFIFPLTSRLSTLHNFTVESQVQYHAPLAFEPKRLTLGDTEASGLTQEDLTVFINSAEWTLGQYCVVINSINT
jgi:phosphatidylinositol glycan class S